MIWPPSPLFISLVVFICVAAVLARRAGLDSLEPNRMLWIVIRGGTVAVALGQVLIPVTYTAVRLSTRGGSIDDNMYPGLPPDQFMFWLWGLAFVAAAVAVWPVVRHIRHSEDEVEDAPDSDGDGL